MVKNKELKVHTLTTALVKAKKYCAYQERSQQEVRDKMYELGLHRNDVEQGIAILIEEGFINEERFAVAFAGGKFRIKQWGKVKIRLALKAKNITDYCIKHALSLIDDTEYTNTAKKLVASQQRKVKENNTLKKNYIIAKYAISRGFEQELVWDIINSRNEF
jgi:regulatory protein